MEGRRDEGDKEDMGDKGDKVLHSFLKWVELL